MIVDDAPALGEAPQDQREDPRGFVLAADQLEAPPDELPRLAEMVAAVAVTAQPPEAIASATATETFSLPYINSFPDEDTDRSGTATVPLYCSMIAYAFN